MSRPIFLAINLSWHTIGGILSAIQRWPAPLTFQIHRLERPRKPLLSASDRTLWPLSYPPRAPCSHRQRCYLSHRYETDGSQQFLSRMQTRHRASMTILCVRRMPLAMTSTRPTPARTPPLATRCNPTQSSRRPRTERLLPDAMRPPRSLLVALDLPRRQKIHHDMPLVSNPLTNQSPNPVPPTVAIPVPFHKVDID